MLAVDTVTVASGVSVSGALGGLDSATTEAAITAATAGADLKALAALRDLLRWGIVARERFACTCVVVFGPEIVVCERERDGDIYTSPKRTGQCGQIIPQRETPYEKEDAQTIWVELQQQTRKCFGFTKRVFNRRPLSAPILPSELRRTNQGTPPVRGFP